jgi:peroxiredoxin
MKGIAVGEPAPSFRLPSALGPEIGLDDFRGRKNTIVWFTKGMACPFCRAHMSQLARGYAEFQKLEAEVLEISLSPPERARFYARNFRLPFPYLCDPDYRVRRRWLLDDRSHNVAWYAMFWFQSLKMKPPASGFGAVNVTPGEKVSLMYDDDSGLFVVDKHGIVRYRLAGSFVDYRANSARPIPSNEEIIAELERCQSGSAASVRTSPPSGT